VASAPLSLTQEDAKKKRKGKKARTWMLLLRNPTSLIGLVLIFGYIFAAVAAPMIAPYKPDEMDLLNRLQPPVWISHNSMHLFGTDELGQDIFSRIVYGARVSLYVGSASILISVVVGTTLGAAAGYFRGWLDWGLSRLTDMLMAFPYLLFTIFAMAILGPGINNLIIALSFKTWVEFYRLVRGNVMDEKTREYVTASQALGDSSAYTMFREILPNIINSIVVLGTLRLGYLMIMEASLSFLGLGVPPGIPAWGSMIASGRSELIGAWWISTMPGVALLVLVLSINLVGEALRDITDPRLADS
jgi:ABC-type dipeptide/oligopeptide/nickel transport system permease subunit